ncbi:polysaccharide deacetylase family protein [Planosporangium sp. 12N6]|uniref:polysaccharide deacetylase family protein n=1 Tax=Planosporangium spinosum TaxID=3402278 RepID=UPI003CEDDE2C
MRPDTPASPLDGPHRPIHRRALLLAATATAGAAVTGGCAAESRWVAGRAGPTGQPAASPTGATVPEVRHGPRDRPAVALTFHGAGEPAQARALLDEVERGGARVTVLAVGSWLAAAPDLARRILDGGHELGNHTQNHLMLTELDAAEVFTEIDACAGVLRRLTGSIGRWFRPSATQYATDVIRAQAARAGYPVCLSYDLDSLDHTDPEPAEVVRAVAGPVGNGSIVSMHLGHAATVAAIPEILDRLRQRGLRPVTMTELVG